MGAPAIRAALLAALASGAVAIGCESVIGLRDIEPPVDASVLDGQGGNEGGPSVDGSLDEESPEASGIDGGASDALDAATAGDSSVNDGAAGDGCTSVPGWCTSHCGPSKDNCGREVSCPSCPAEAGCGTGACDSGSQCCTGYCGPAGTCVSTCTTQTGPCTLSECCYGLTCAPGFPPVIHTCQ
jgi:hypothetical protein